MTSRLEFGQNDLDSEKLMWEMDCWAFGAEILWGTSQDAKEYLCKKSSQNIQRPKSYEFLKLPLGFLGFEF